MFNKCGLIYTIVTAEGILFLIFLSTYPPPHGIATDSCAP